MYIFRYQLTVDLFITTTKKTTTFCIVLLAVFDARYRFTLVHIGGTGRKSDSGIYSSNSICKSIDNNALNFPQPKLIGNYRDNIVFPYVFVADKRSVMKPNRFVLIPEVMPLMKQNMSSVIVFLEQGGLLKTI